MSGKLNENPEQQEEDVPESFFDDLMSEDFIEGLNVVDAWEGDDVRTNISTSNFVDKTHFSAQPIEKLSKLPAKNEKTEEKEKETKLSKEKEKKRKRHKEKTRDRNGKVSKRSSISRILENRGSRRSKSRDRRDPTKTQRDILKDKDKCEKDKTTKMIYEKLKVVETGLVPPGTEMEVELQNANKDKANSKLEEGEIPAEQDLGNETKSKSIEHKRDLKPERPSYKKHSRSKESPLRIVRRRFSPEFRRIRSRSRSLRRRQRSRDRSKSMERRKERRRRTRSRSFERNRGRYRSPLRKSSPLVKRNQNLHKEIDVLKARLFDGRKSPEPIRNIREELLQAARDAEAKSKLAQNLANNSLQFPQPVPIPNPNFIPLQPVPPPQQHQIELDQQFFIGQPAMEQNPYQVPLQQPVMLHNPVMVPLGPTPEMQQNFVPNWPMEQPQFLPEFFNNQQNLGQALGQPINFMEGPMNMPLPQQHQMQFSQHVPQPVPPVVHRENEEEIFAKLFAENKITLSDYLSVTAKNTDNSNPVDIQNKIKVISHCQEAVQELTGSAKPTGRFLLRKSHKSPVKVSNVEGLTPFKKVPVIKFQFTTFTKQVDDKQLAPALNRLMFRLCKETQFEELPLPPVSASVKNDPKEVPVKQPKVIIVEKEIKKSTSTLSTQTDPPMVKDFGCQVTPEDIPSPMKSALKKQSLAQLTPAQLLAQERNISPPPAPRWIPPSEARNQSWDTGRDSFRDDVDRRAHIPGLLDLPVIPRPFPGRNPANPLLDFLNRSLEPSNNLYYGNRL